MEFEGNKDQIHKAFTAYVEHVSEILTRRPSLQERMIENSIKVAYIDPGFRLRSLVEKLETSAEFNDLSSAIDRAVNTNGQKAPSKKMRYHSIYALSLPNFFKRSHFYTNTYKGHKAVPDDLFDS